MTRYYRRHLDDRQVHRRWLDPRLGSVRVADLQAYLSRKGWQQVSADEPGVLIFQEPGETEDGPLYQWVPSDERGRDYVQRVYELLAAIAEVENRHAGDVLTDVLGQTTDGTTGNGPGLSHRTETAPSR
jgi:hypothetical protein